MSSIETFFRTSILTYRAKPYVGNDENNGVLFWAPSDLSNFSKFGVLPERSPFNYFFEECEWNPIIKKKVQGFMEKVEYIGVYNSCERDMIGRALMMATVAHQYNNDRDSRYRKETFPNTSEHIPYIFHPIEIAERLITDGFDWITVCASLLHDVPEDADLGDGLNSKEDWLNIIRNEFNYAGRINNIKVGMNQDLEAGDLLAELIDGVTEKKFHFSAGEKDRDEYLRIRQIPLYKIIFSFVERGGSNNPKALARDVTYEERLAIASVTHNLEILFNAALKSPDHWRIFILKIADIWHNYQSIEMVKSSKILRGKIAANLAEWFGWYGMRSEIIRKLGQETDTASAYSPDIGGNASPGNYPTYIDRDLDGIAQDANAIVRKLSSVDGWSRAKRATVETGWPVTSIVDLGRLYGHANPRWKSPGDWQSSTLIRPQVIIGIEDLVDLEKHLPENDPFRLRHNLAYRITIPKTVLKKGYVRSSIVRSDTHISQFMTNALGRRRFDYRVNMGMWNNWSLRIEDRSKPYIKDLFRNGFTYTPDMVPEAGLFNNLLRSDSSRWNYHVTALISMLYDVNTPFSRGELSSELYALSWQGNILFINTRHTTLGSVAELLGQQIDDELEIQRLDGEIKHVSKNDFLIGVYELYGDDLFDRLIIIPK